MFKDFPGRFPDGPCTTFLPETLLKILEENGVAENLRQQVGRTLNAQKHVSFQEGYDFRKEMEKK